MIATMSKNVWEFKSELKQRVSDYLKKNPRGDYNHFQENWRRAIQVDRRTFDEVYMALQKAGALRIEEGGKTYDQMRADIERDLLKSGFIRKPQAPPDFVPAPPVPERPVVPAQSAPTTAPLSFPNAHAFDPEPTTNEDTVAKELSVLELSPEQREKLDRIVQVTPRIEYEDLCEKLGFNLKKQAFHGMRNSLKNNRWIFKHLAGNVAATRTMARDRMTMGTGMIPFINKTKISKPETVGWLDVSNGYTQEDIMFIGKRLPSIISELFASEMAFKFYRTQEFESDGVSEKLELKRVR